MKIKNATYANTPIATKLGTFTPDASGSLEVSEDEGKLLCSLAGFTAERTQRVLTREPDAASVKPPRSALVGKWRDEMLKHEDATYASKSAEREATQFRADGDEASAAVMDGVVATIARREAAAAPATAPAPEVPDVRASDMDDSMPAVLAETPETAPTEPAAPVAATASARRVRGPKPK